MYNKTEIYKTKRNIYIYETQYNIIPKYIKRNFSNILNQIYQIYISDI